MGISQAGLAVADACGCVTATDRMQEITECMDAVAATGFMAAMFGGVTADILEKTVVRKHGPKFSEDRSQR